MYSHLRPKRADPLVFQRQNTVESSSFGSEFVALRTAKDTLVALQYKLRTPILAKKPNAINYQAIHEAVAARIIRVGKEDGMTNLADLFTKALTADRRRALCHNMMC